MDLYLMYLYLMKKKRERKSKEKNKINNLNISEVRDESIYEIEDIIEHKIKNDQLKFLVR